MDKYRNYSKGKSFKFSKWNALDTYNNDPFVQDWVLYKGKLYVCLKTNTNVIPGTTPDWELVMDSKEGLKWIRI